MKKLQKRSVGPKQKRELDAAHEVVLGVRIERETKSKLAVIAREQRRSLSGQALLFIEKGVKHHEENAALTPLGSSAASGVKHPADTPATKRKPTSK